METTKIVIYVGIILLGLLAINGTGLLDKIKLIRPELKKRIMLFLSIASFALIGYAYYIGYMVK